MFDVVEEVIASLLIFCDNVVAGFGFEEIINFYDFGDVAGLLQRNDLIFVALEGNFCGLDFKFIHFLNSAELVLVELVPSLVDHSPRA